MKQPQVMPLWLVPCWLVRFPSIFEEYTANVFFLVTLTLGVIVASLRESLPPRLNAKMTWREPSILIWTGLQILAVHNVWETIVNCLTITGTMQTTPSEWSLLMVKGSSLSSVHDDLQEFKRFARGKALKEEAKSTQHLLTHIPKNALRDMCQRAKMFKPPSRTDSWRIN